MPTSFECRKSKREVFLENFKAVTRGNFKEILDALKSRDIKLIAKSTRSLLRDFYGLFAWLNSEDKFGRYRDFDFDIEIRLASDAEAQARFHAQIQDKWPQPKSASNPGNSSRDDAFFRGYWPNSRD